MKKARALIATMVIAVSFATPVMAKPVPQSNQGIKSIEQQKAEWNDFNVNFSKESTSSNGASTFSIIGNALGTYPTTPGVFLVTDAFTQTSLTGHAGMVVEAGKAVESFPTGGVQYRTDSWTTRYTTVYSATVKNTTPTQQQNAVKWATDQVGKPYNYNFFNTETTNSFYCSQLVYKAYKQTTGININYGGGIVYPIDLVKSTNVDAYKIK